MFLFILSFNYDVMQVQILRL